MTTTPPTPEPQPSTSALPESLGRLAVKWIEGSLIHGEGGFYGRPYRLTPDQKLFLYRWYEYTTGGYNTDTGEHDPDLIVWSHRRGLLGRPKGEGKTEFLAAIAMLEFAGPYPIAQRSPVVQIAASSFDQAKELFTQVQIMAGGPGGNVQEAPLRGFFDVFDTQILFADGRPGKIERVAAAAGSNDGAKPSLVLCDELHEWTGNRERVHTVLANGPTKRFNGRELNISTAGVGRGSIPPKPTDSLLWKMYAEGLMHEADPTVAPELLFDWREAAEHWNLDDPAELEAAIREASPSAGLLWPIEARMARRRDPKVPAHEFARYFLNRWVDAASDGWMADNPSAWAECLDDKASIPPGATVIVAVDMSLRHDSTAVVTVWQRPDKRIVAEAKVFTANEATGKVDYLEVFDYITDTLGVDYFVDRIVYDPRLFELAASMLEDRGFLVVEMPQSPERMSPACGYAFELIVDGIVAHVDDPVFASHVNGAARREGDRGFTLSKSKSRTHIDACIALVMALWELAQPGPEEIDLLNAIH